MDASRKTAILVGALFLIALILNLIATEILNPILNIPDYLVYAYPNKNAVILANMLNLICAIAMIFIPISLFPIVRKQDQHVATGYMVFRALEGILFIYMTIKTLSFISLSKAYLNAGTQTASYLQTLGDSIHAELQWAVVIDVIVFTLGAGLFYCLLYKSKLVPRFLSVWGLVAALILFAGAITALFGVGIFSDMPFMKAMVYFAPPIALNELVLGIWLLVKGFNTSESVGSYNN